MDQDHKATINRQAGAEAISARAIAIGSEIGAIIVKCDWDLGSDSRLQHAHRLDLFTDAKSVRLYFPDVELTTTGNAARTKRTEERLRSAIAQLLSLSRAPTYSTQEKNAAKHD